MLGWGSFLGVVATTLICAFYHSFNFLTFPFLSFTTDYHLRSVSNFALSKLEPGTDPSLDILHNFEAADSGKYAACVVSFFRLPDNFTTSLTG